MNPPPPSKEHLPSGYKQNPPIIPLLSLSLSLLFQSLPPSDFTLYLTLSHPCLSSSLSLFAILRLCIPDEPSPVSLSLSAPLHYSTPPVAIPILRGRGGQKSAKNPSLRTKTPPPPPVGNSRAVKTFCPLFDPTILSRSFVFSISSLSLSLSRSSGKKRKRIYYYNNLFPHHHPQFVILVPALLESLLSKFGAIFFDQGGFGAIFNIFFSSGRRGRGREREKERERKREREGEEEREGEKRERGREKERDRQRETEREREGEKSLYLSIPHQPHCPRSVSPHNSPPPSEGGSASTAREQQRPNSSS